MINKPNTGHQLALHSKLGQDLPDTEEQLFQLVDIPVLDTQIVKNIFNEGWEEYLNVIVTTFLETLPEEKKLMEFAHNNHNWEQIDKLAHKMKGGCLYMGTRKLTMACQYLERHLKTGHHEQAERLYQQMMRVMDETVLVLNSWVKTHY